MFPGAARVRYRGYCGRVRPQPRISASNSSRRTAPEPGAGAGGDPRPTARRLRSQLNRPIAAGRAVVCLLRCMADFTPF